MDFLSWISSKISILITTTTILLFGAGPIVAPTPVPTDDQVQTETSAQEAALSPGNKNSQSDGYTTLHIDTHEEKTATAVEKTKSPTPATVTPPVQKKSSPPTSEPAPLPIYTSSHPSKEDLNPNIFIRLEGMRENEQLFSRSPEPRKMTAAIESTQHATSSASNQYTFYLLIGTTSKPDGAALYTKKLEEIPTSFEIELHQFDHTEGYEWFMNLDTKKPFTPALMTARLDRTSKVPYSEAEIQKLLSEYKTKYNTENSNSTGKDPYTSPESFEKTIRLMTKTETVTIAKAAVSPIYYFGITTMFHDQATGYYAKNGSALLTEDSVLDIWGGRFEVRPTSITSSSAVFTKLMDQQPVGTVTVPIGQQGDATIVFTEMQDIYDSAKKQSSIKKFTATLPIKIRYDEYFAPFVGSFTIQTDGPFESYQ